MKSYNLTLKAECKECDLAKERKKARIEREKENEVADAAAENDNEVGETREDPSSEEEEDQDEEEVELEREESRKRKRTGENHTHCHCPLFTVPDELADFMAGGQPYQRFKKESDERREAAKVERILLLQKRKEVEQKYKFDLKKEWDRFKKAFRESEKEKLKKDSEKEKRKKTEAAETPVEQNKRSRREEIEDKRRKVREDLPLLF